MINPRKMLTTIAALALVASLAFASQARADTLVLGNTAGPSITTSIKGTVQGGNIPNSTLDGSSVPWVYCVDLNHTITIPGTYNATTTTTNGVVNGAVVGGSLTVANEIAYLLIKYGVADIGTLEGALQAAIWTLEYGAGTVTAISSEGTLTQMNNYVSEAQGANTTGDAGFVTWLTPGSTSSPGTVYQGLVTITNEQLQTVTVPEPSTLAIAGLGALAFIGYGLRRRKRA